MLQKLDKRGKLVHNIHFQTSSLQSVVAGMDYAGDVEESMKSSSLCLLKNRIREIFQNRYDGSEPPDSSAQKVLVTRDRDRGKVMTQVSEGGEYEFHNGIIHFLTCMWWWRPD